MRSIIVNEKYRVDTVCLRETIGGWAVDIVVKDREAPNFKTFEDVRQNLPTPMDKRMWKGVLIKRIRSLWDGPMMEVGLWRKRHTIK